MPSQPPTVSDFQSTGVRTNQFLGSNVIRNCGVVHNHRGCRTSNGSSAAAALASVPIENEWDTLNGNDQYKQSVGQNSTARHEHARVGRVGVDLSLSLS